MFYCKSAENWRMRLMWRGKSLHSVWESRSSRSRDMQLLHIAACVPAKSGDTSRKGGGAWRTKIQGDVNKVFLIRRSCKDTQRCAVSLLAPAVYTHSFLSTWPVQSESVNAALTLYFHSQHKSVSSSRRGICGIPAVISTRTKADSEHNTVL